MKEQDLAQSPYAARLGLPSAHAARMRAMVASSARTILSIHPEWYRARFHSKTHLRIFCGRLIVAALEGKYVWLALDEDSIGPLAGGLRSLIWDDELTRPKDAKGKAYPRYKSPASRNVFYDPSEDPEGQEQHIIENAHYIFLRRAATEGRAPDHRTKSDPGLEDEIATWGSERVFELAVGDAIKLDSEKRWARLRQAPKKPKARVTTVVVFERSADVVAEVLLRAGGVCEICKSPAPFRRASDGTPYLEVHHRIRLADNGDDSVENAVAICPNCHRQQHFG